LPPGAPDRPGLLQTLTAALLLRWEERGGDVRLDRLSALAEETLATLPAHAPDRVAALVTAGEVWTRRAQCGAGPGALDRALAAYREALRLVRPASPHRSTVVLGYATLALRTDATVAATRQVRSAFSRAVAVATPTPVPLLAASRAWGDWEAGRGRWSIAATAYGVAVTAHRRMIAVQLSSRLRYPWLRYDDTLAAVAATAAGRAGRYAEAVVILEGGRATEASRAIDEHRVVALLARAGQAALADRLTRAASWLAALDAVAAPVRAGRPA
jgi:hypothetical protein